MPATHRLGFYSTPLAAPMPTSEWRRLSRLFAMPMICNRAVSLLFLAVGVAYGNGGGLALAPFAAFTSQELGFNYGLVFIGWGIAFFRSTTGRLHQGRDWSWTYSISIRLLLACGVTG